MAKEIALFEEKQIRRLYDSEKEIWYFSVIDIIEALTGSRNARDYWFKMKIRVKSDDGLELSTIFRQLKLMAADGKMRFLLADTNAVPTTSFKVPITK